ncbi:hypothetical protein GV054_19920 [Marinomonas mediterranea]|uniref:Uncharacterized protein n=1 Tax=Marinomonas mediterranea (strain ATCC 700492 / JCM 21426 / NBRC 103028 / MMB-1) TaxID=717774 RepID=F2JYM6_MARM1|nr:hypothetical protein [Marinomonas mediterranea]ADZ93155.1 hypothetical protein Marme_3946 [Marinomonas mediterranea MMB-1]WCN15119.1 hypothetical protein GV054_19920 [Marinomonas mediterranea]WCN19162.1 hypothetical protein GV053_19980 [Marinomonas mediterranea MMB-1]
MSPYLYLASSVMLTTFIYAISAVAAKTRHGKDLASHVSITIILFSIFVGTGQYTISKDGAFFFIDFTENVYVRVLSLFMAGLSVLIPIRKLGRKK